MSKRSLLPGILSCLVGIALPSCAVQSRAALPATAPLSASLSPVPSATAPSDNPAWPTLPSAQGTTIASPPAIPESPTLVNIHCATPGSNLPPTADGSLVSDGPDGPLLIQLESGDSAPLLGDPTIYLGSGWYFPLESPGAHFIALVANPYDSPRLIVLDEDGNEVAHQSWKENWSSIVGWIDEDRLQISAEAELPGTMIVLNPFTGQASVLSPEFPDLYTLPPYPYWSGPGGAAVFDSTLTRAAYFGYDGEHALFIWGIPERVKLWRSPAVSESLSPPVWSPDSSRIALEVLLYGETATPGILTIIRRDGQLVEAILLEDAEAPKSQRLAPLFPAWSPDGNRIAFWIDRYGLADSAPTVTLGLLDLETKRVIDFCVPGDLNGLALPIWSPDGRFIAVSGAIVDTAEFTSYQLTSADTPIGWLMRE
jgi:hypothetical protein